MNTTINTVDLLNYLNSLQTEQAISLDEGELIFLQYKKLHNRYGTFKYYKEQLLHILTYMRNHQLQFTNQIDNKIIDTFVNERIVNVKPSTVNKEVKALLTMMRHLLKKGLISKINFTFEKLPTTKTKIESIKESDIKKIIDYLDKGNFTEQRNLIFKLILTTGIRTNELCNIQNANIDLKNKKILLEFTKNKKPRYIYIVDQLIPLVKKVMSKHTYLFNLYDKQISQHFVYDVFRELKTKLKIDVLSPHKLRHYYATSIYKDSLDIYLVSKLLGHCDIKTTEIYLDVDENNNQKKNEFYNPLNKFTEGLH